MSAAPALLLLTAGHYPLAFDLVTSHAGWGATTRLFRRQCPAWLTPAVIEATGYHRLPTSKAHRDSTFEKQGVGGVRFLIKVTICGEFRHLAGHEGHLVGYSQHHGEQAHFASEMAAFERRIYHERKIAA